MTIKPTVPDIVRGQIEQALRVLEGDGVMEVRAKNALVLHVVKLHQALSSLSQVACGAIGVPRIEELEEAVAVWLNKEQSRGKG